MATAKHTIIQISDVHIVPEGQLLNDKVDTLANVAAVLQAIEDSSITPEALVFTGDLADAGQPESYQRLRAVIEPAAARIGAPFFYAMGNHDERAAFRAGLLGAEPTAEDYDYVAWIGDLRLIVMDSTVPGHHHGELTDQQLAWLRDELATPAPDGTVLAFHHPPVPSPIELGGIILTNPEDLVPVLAGSDVKVILTGHAHHSSGGSIAGIPVWIAGATAYQLDALSPNIRGIRGSVYTRVDLFEEGAVATALPVVSDNETLYEVTQEQIAQHAAKAEAEAAAASAAAGATVAV
jgi:Icc-related predicted phosphoesterase